MRFDFATAIRGLNKRQKDALIQLALDNSDGVHPATFEAFERRGLVEGSNVTLPGRFPVTYRQYRMPLHVHIPCIAWIADTTPADECDK